MFIADGDTLDVGLTDATVGGAFAAPGLLGPATINATPVGTVQQVDPNTSEVVLAAAAGAGLDLPAGTHLGVNSIKEIYGLYPYSLDFTEFKTNYDVGIYDEAAVYRGALPYFDGTIKSQLPELDIRFKF